jgi:hypothetical protein
MFAVLFLAAAAAVHFFMLALATGLRVIMDVMFPLTVLMVWARVSRSRFLGTAERCCGNAENGGGLEDEKSAPGFWRLWPGIGKLLD